MKKIFSVLLTCSLSAAFVGNASAQVFASNYTSSGTRAASASIDNQKGSLANSIVSKADYKAAKATMKANKANLKATTNFSQTFKEAQGARWITEPKVIYASFNNDGVYTRVVYTKKGNWLHTISTYNEDKLSSDVARLIERNFAGYEITQVQDIKEGRIQFYVIHLESKRGYKQVCVYDGEVGVLSEFDKQRPKS